LGVALGLAAIVSSEPNPSVRIINGAQEQARYPVLVEPPVQAEHTDFDLRCTNGPQVFEFAPVGSSATIDARLPKLGLDLAPAFGLVFGLIDDGATAVADLAAGLRWRWAARRQTVASSLGGHTKRVCDIVVAATAILLLLPIMLLVAALIRYKMGGPAIFAHRRIGFQGHQFGCLKFRTMVNNGDQVLQQRLARSPAAAQEWQDTRKLKDDPRVTPLGRFLRKTSIDELPQLWNVLVGDMSCVGPRPVVAEELELYGRGARHYLITRPGITGMWQVSGRSNTTYARRVALDRLYVRQWTIWQDIRLLILTIPAVLRSSEAA
jgi:exopolysaccharide production protein ExoY